MLPIKNKGMFLESVLNQTHQKYLDQNLCLVSKMPTNYVISSNNNFNKLNFIENFNCDYIGCYQGHYFEFEAKETNLMSFKFQNIRQNQVRKLDLVVENKAIGFLIIYFSQIDRYFFIDWKKLKTFVLENKKTIPLEWFEENGYELFINSQLMLDYLMQINHLINCIS